MNGHLEGESPTPNQLGDKTEKTMVAVRWLLPYGAPREVGFLEMASVFGWLLSGCFFFWKKRSCLEEPRICSRRTVRVNGSRACSAGLWRLVLAFFFIYFANEAKNHGENPDEHQLLGGGNSNIFYFHPYLGKIPILTSIFFKWCGSTTN